MASCKASDFESWEDCKQLAHETYLDYRRRTGNRKPKRLLMEETKQNASCEELNKQLLEILGIPDVGKTRDVTVYFPVRGPAIATVEYRIDKTNETEVQKFELKPLDE